VGSRVGETAELCAVAVTGRVLSISVMVDDSSIHLAVAIAELPLIAEGLLDTGYWDAKRSDFAENAVERHLIDLLYDTFVLSSSTVPSSNYAYENGHFSPAS
jgi:hypothetical protein